MALVIYNCIRCDVERRMEYPLHDRWGVYRLGAHGHRIYPGIRIFPKGNANNIRADVEATIGGDVEVALCPICHSAMRYDTKAHARVVEQDNCA